MSCRRFRTGVQIWAARRQAPPEPIEPSYTPPTAETRLYTYHVTARKRKILIVDDDAGIRSSLGVLVQSWGFEAFLASDAREALDLVEKEEPDIVISDVVMPETSGLELLRTLKAGDPNRPV